MKLLSKNTLKFLFASLIASIFMISCEDLNVSSLVSGNEVGSEAVADAVEDVAARGSAGSTHRDGCFDLVYPVSVAFPDGTTASADSAEELHDLLMDWKVANGDTTGRPSLVFPVNVVLSDGTTQAIDDEEEFKDILADCGYGKAKRDKRGKRDRKDKRNKHGREAACYELLFPITVAFPDNTTSVADSAAELRRLFRAWKANDSTRSGRPTFVYPYDVLVLSDSSVVTVNAESDLDAIRNDCFARGRGTRCGNDSTGVGQ